MAAGCGPRLHLSTPRIFRRQHIHLAGPKPATINPLAATTPAEWAFDNLVYDSLLSVSPAGRLVPDIAARWQVADGGRVWTFYLNPHAKWWNGRPITAHDVAWTYRLYARTPARDPGGDLSSLIARIATEGPTTVTFFLKAPDPAFGADMAAANTGHWILPAFALDRVAPGAVAASPYLNRVTDLIGSGPYRPVVWKAQWARFESNPRYVLGAPKVRLLIWYWTADLTPAFLVSHDIDLAYGPALTPPPHTALPGLRASSDLTAGAYVLAVNPQSWFARPAVRRAVAAALNLPSLTRDGLGGQARVAVGPELPSAGAAPAPYAYNPARAAGLLAAIHPRPRAVRIGIPVSLPGAAPVARALAADLSRVGLAVTLVALPESQWAAPAAGPFPDHVDLLYTRLPPTAPTAGEAGQDPVIWLFWGRQTVFRSDALVGWAANPYIPFYAPETWRLAGKAKSSSASP